MSDALITPIEKVTPGYWWARQVYKKTGTIADEYKPASLRGEWIILHIKGTFPFLYMGMFYHLTGDGPRYDVLHHPEDIEFGCKIEEMPEEV